MYEPNRQLDEMSCVVNIKRMKTMMGKCYDVIKYSGHSPSYYKKNQIVKLEGSCYERIKVFSTILTYFFRIKQHSTEDAETFSCCYELSYIFLWSYQRVFVAFQIADFYSSRKRAHNSFPIFFYSEDVLLMMK